MIIYSNPHSIYLINLYFIFSPSSKEYKIAMKIIMNEVQKHKNSLIVGEPQLNVCDDAVMVSSKKNFQK